MKLLIKIISCILSISILSLSQNQAIIFKTNNNSYKINPKKISHDILETDVAKGKYCYAFFSMPINSEFANELESTGIIIAGSIGRYSSRFGYKFNLNGKNRLALQILEKSSSFLSLIPISASDKVESAIFNGDQKCFYNKEKRTIKAAVFLEDPLDISKAKNAFGNLVDSIVYQAGISRKYIVFSSPEKLCNLAANDIISNVNLWRENQISNDYARKILKVDSLQRSFLIKNAIPSVNWLKDVPFTGDSIWVWNTEDSIGKHIDFCEIDGNDTVVRYADTIRVLYKDYNWGFTFHGIATMGVLCGNGWGSLASIKFPGSDTMQWRGVAPKCQIRFSDDADIINRSFADESGYYTTTARGYDEGISNHYSPDKKCNNIWTLASGNDGDAAAKQSLITQNPATF